MRLLMSLAVVAFAACGTEADDGASARDTPTSTAVEHDASTKDSAVPEAIRCQTQYRPDAATTAGVQEPSLFVNRVDEGVLAQHEQVAFDNMVLEATFAGDLPEGHSFAFRVTTSDGVQLLQSLYQYDTGEELRTSFSGGHGFTGLNYVDHEGASLQIWCSAAGA